MELSPPIKQISDLDNFNLKWRIGFRLDPIFDAEAGSQKCGSLLTKVVKGDPEINNFLLFREVKKFSEFFYK